MGKNSGRMLYNHAEEGTGIITSRTLKTGFPCFCRNEVYHSEERENCKSNPEIISGHGYAANRIKVNFKPGDELFLQICFSAVFTEPSKKRSC